MDRGIFTCTHHSQPLENLKQFESNRREGKVKEKECGVEGGKEIGEKKRTRGAMVVFVDKKLFFLVRCSWRVLVPPRVAFLVAHPAAARGEQPNHGDQHSGPHDAKTILFSLLPFTFFFTLRLVKLRRVEEDSLIRHSSNALVLLSCTRTKAEGKGLSFTIRLPQWRINQKPKSPTC